MQKVCSLRTLFADICRRRGGPKVCSLQGEEGLFFLLPTLYRFAPAFQTLEKLQSNLLALWCHGKDGCCSLQGEDGLFFLLPKNHFTLLKSKSDLTTQPNISLNVSVTPCARTYHLHHRTRWF
ncbi:hypothetical protein HanIR_Chr03g0135511 [Helianthus annuus]|nr:hypothetical protein HanIR_Chr03g0135511 [Helianthus annuus]